MIEILGAGTDRSIIHSLASMVGTVPAAVMTVTVIVTVVVAVVVVVVVAIATATATVVKLGQS